MFQGLPWGSQALGKSTRVLAKARQPRGFSGCGTDGQTQVLP